jgi:hypothetical protein
VRLISQEPGANVRLPENLLACLSDWNWPTPACHKPQLATRTGQSIFSIADIGVLTDYVGFYSGIAVTLTVALVSHRPAAVGDGACDG